MNSIMQYECIILVIFISFIISLKLNSKTKLKEVIDIHESNNYRIENESISSSSNDNDSISTDNPSQKNVIQILGGSDFVNATTSLNEVFSVLIEGYSENDGNWFIANKDALTDYITPINIQDDGLTTKFIPDEYATDGNEKICTYVFNFKAIKSTSEAIELRFELKHPYDPMAIRTIAVNIMIE